MGFLLRCAFWFSLVLLFLPLSPSDDGDKPVVSPLEAIVAARDAIGDLSGMCEREPEVCQTGRAAIQTIGVRARETARIAYELLEKTPEGGEAPTDPDPSISTGAVVPRPFSPPAH